MPFFTSKTSLHQHEKGHPANLCILLSLSTPIWVAAISTSLHKGTLCSRSPITSSCTLKSSGCNINFTTSGYSSSTLPIYIYVSSQKPADNLAPRPRNHLCSLIGAAQRATASHFLRGALFHLQNSPPPIRNRALPSNLCTQLSLSTPVRVAAMSTSLHKGTLCPMLANHFIFRAQVAATSPSLRPPESLQINLTHGPPKPSLLTHVAGQRPSLPYGCPFSCRKRQLPPNLYILLSISSPYRRAWERQADPKGTPLDAKAGFRPLPSPTKKCVYIYKYICVYVCVCYIFIYTYEEYTVLGCGFLLLLKSDQSKWVG